jgi:arsenate reductase (glutaredoxin)
MKVYGLPHCSTTQKALRLLEAKGNNVTLIDYREHPLRLDELQSLVARAKLPIQKWLNTSGQAYRDQKEELLQLSEDEVIQRLAETPMLMKRPVVVTSDTVWVGIPKGGY